PTNPRLTAPAYQAPPAIGARATRLARFNQRPSVAERPTLAAPTTPPIAPATRRNRILLGLALFAGIALAALLVAAWQRNQALEAEVARLQDNVTTLRDSAAQGATRESELDTILRLQKDKLTGQAEQIESAGQDMQGVQQDLQDLRARMNRLDQHNAALRDA